MHEVCINDADRAIRMIVFRSPTSLVAITSRRSVTACDKQNKETMATVKECKAPSRPTDATQLNSTSSGVGRSRRGLRRPDFGAQVNVGSIICNAVIITEEHRGHYI